MFLQWYDVMLFLMDNSYCWLLFCHHLEIHLFRKLLERWKVLLAARELEQRGPESIERRMSKWQGQGPFHFSINVNRNNIKNITKVIITWEIYCNIVGLQNWHITDFTRLPHVCTAHRAPYQVQSPSLSLTVTLCQKSPPSSGTQGTLLSLSLSYDQWNRYCSGRAGDASQLSRGGGNWAGVR